MANGGSRVRERWSEFLCEETILPIVIQQEFLEMMKEPELKIWLEGQDRQVASCVSARAAMRVLPMLDSYVLRDTEKWILQILVPCFRAVQASWFVACWVKSESGILSAANSLLGKQAQVDTSFDFVVTATTARACGLSAYAAAAVEDFDSAGAAHSSIRASISAFHNVDTKIYDVLNNELATDIGLLEGQKTRDQLWRQSLWEDEFPILFSKSWSTLKQYLLSQDENWQVWTDWYEDRLRGFDDPQSRPLIEALERERVLIPNEDWEKGAAHVNAIIAELEEKYRNPDLHERVRQLEELLAKPRTEQRQALGGAYETRLRSNLQRDAELLRQFNRKDKNVSGESLTPGMGHNNPPIDISSIEPGLEKIEAELAMGNPNPDVVAEETSKIVEYIKATLDDVRSGFGKTVGGAIAVGVGFGASKVPEALMRFLESAYLWLSAIW